MNVKLLSFLKDAEIAMRDQVTEVKISALQQCRWEICRFLDELIAHEEQLLGQRLEDPGLDNS